MGYFDYLKEKDFLICIDSDGCAMDTMNSKHFNSFGPEFVKSYDLEEYREGALEYWNQINLFTKTRGRNRIKGLDMAVREMSKMPREEKRLHGEGSTLEYPCKFIYS